MSDAFQRWQDNSRRSLEFVNNTLIALGSGLLAVALGGAADTAKLAHLLTWQRAASGIAVILLGLSVLVGVATAANRLQSARLTARIIRIRDLRQRAFAPGASSEAWELSRLNPGFSQGLGGWAACLNVKVLLTWDDKGCRGLYHSQFEEHFLRERYRMVAGS